MCGRYSNGAEFSDIRVRFEADDEVLVEWRPRLNIAPGFRGGHEQLIVVDHGGGQRALRAARWWFVPSWWERPLRELPTAFNARSEDVAKKPMFRDALRDHRCLVPATGWREFTGAKAPKQPHHFHFENHAPFAFAGLWSTAKSEDGEVFDSFTILTTEPTAKAAAIHDRMPLGLAPELYGAWLDPSRGGMEALAKAREAAARLDVSVYPSNPIANTVHFEGPESIAPRE